MQCGVVSSVQAGRRKIIFYIFRIFCVPYAQNAYSLNFNSMPAAHSRTWHLWFFVSVSSQHTFLFFKFMLVSSWHDHLNFFNAPVALIRRRSTSKNCWKLQTRLRSLHDSSSLARLTRWSVPDWITNWISNGSELNVETVKTEYFGDSKLLRLGEPALGDISNAKCVTFISAH